METRLLLLDDSGKLIDVAGGTCFAVSISKTRLHHPMSLKTTMPLQLQVLVEHFDAECRSLNRIGMIIADWSSHRYDQHASQCVASFAASRGLTVHPGVYYASSHANEGIQVADLIAGVRRRVVEGDSNLVGIEGLLRRIQGSKEVGGTVKGRQFKNWVDLI